MSICMLRVGLLGCGNIGKIIVKNNNSVDITALFDKLPERADEAALISGGKPCSDFSSFISEELDLVVEAASVKAVREYGVEVLSSNKDLVVLSVGAFSDPVFREDMIATAEQWGRKIYIPSGAIIGLDNLKVGQISEITHLLLRTTKSPASLGITAYEKTLVFKGKANECIKEFPRNVNVSVALSLAAGRDADVELWADPSVERNIHEIFVEGVFGEAYLKISNVPSPDNPGTSYLAALSILTLLKNLENPLVVGT